MLGDLVLANQGFTIQDSVEFYCAEVKTPFTKGRKQLSCDEVDWSREISQVWLHIEWVIGVLKHKYTILQGTIPITMLKDGTNSNITRSSKKFEFKKEVGIAINRYAELERASYHPPATIA